VPRLSEGGLNSRRAGILAASDEQTSFFGGGNAHLQQEATVCGFTFEDPASEFIPEGEFPENVEPTDILKFSVEGPVIINP
jgi:hypothetical protein